MYARSESDEKRDQPLLFNTKRVQITPAWLTVDKTHYAIKTIARLDYQPQKPPVKAAFGVMGVATVLIAISLYRLILTDLDTTVAIVMLLVSVSFWLFALVLILTMKPRHLVKVTLLDGQSFPVKSRVASDIEGMIAGLRQAMMWQTQHQDQLAEELPIQQRVRRRLARAEAEEVRDTFEMPNQQTKRVLPVIASILKGRS